MKLGKCRVQNVDVTRFFDSHWEYAACKFCADCPVKRDCLKYALDNKIEDGVWGGMTAKERIRYDRR